MVTSKNALTVYDAMTSWEFIAQEKEKEKNAGESVTHYFRTRNGILGDSSI